MKHFGDITKLSGHELPIVDVITGGSPCQDLSVAGARAGLAGERSGLFMEQLRIVREMRERDRLENGRSGHLCRPRFMVWENVPGAFSSNRGEDFRAVLSEIVRIAEPDAPDVPLPETGKWPKSGCLYDEMGRWSVAWRVHDAQFWGVAQRRRRISLVADFGGLAGPEVLFERTGLHWDPPQSREERQGTAEDAEGCADGTSISFQPMIVKDESGQETDPIMIEMTSTKNTIVDNGVSPTLTARMGTGGNQVNALCVGNGQLHQISMAEQANTLDTMHDQQAICVFDKEMYNAGSGCTGTLQAREDTVAPTCRADAHPSGVVQNMVVRRLTPLECERLQGFPDGWTDIGDWVDTKGKRHRAADSPRYKALGNSIALPFWFWLLRRIAAQYERPAMLGSLFDGIGGFPLVWERCNGKGTALWASEIEEFCIAVTKKHFPEEGGENEDG